MNFIYDWVISLIKSNDDLLIKEWTGMACDLPTVLLQCWSHNSSHLDGMFHWRWIATGWLTVTRPAESRSRCHSDELRANEFLSMDTGLWMTTSWLTTSLFELLPSTAETEFELARWRWLERRWEPVADGQPPADQQTADKPESTLRSTLFVFLQLFCAVRNSHAVFFFFFVPRFVDSLGFISTAVFGTLPDSEILSLRLAVRTRLHKSLWVQNVIDNPLKSDVTSLTLPCRSNCWLLPEWTSGGR